MMETADPKLYEIGVNFMAASLEEAMNALNLLKLCV